MMEQIRLGGEYEKKKGRKKKKKQTLHSAATEIQEIKGKKRETEGPCTQ
jgi:hypothetical protein